MTVEERYDNYSLDYFNQEEDPHDIFYWEELIPVLVVSSLTFIIGLIGNILIIFTTYRYRRMQSVTNVLLASLASCDLLLIIVCIPVKVAKLFSYTWRMGMFACKGVHYIQNVTAICSVLTLTTISFERYYAIVHPMKAKYIRTISQAKKNIIILWVLSIILGVPTLIVQTHLPVGNKQQYFWCVKNWDDSLMWILHETYLLFLILIAPFIIMIFCYLLICQEVYKVMYRRSVMTNEKALNANQNEKVLETYEFNNGRTNIGRDDAQLIKQVICMLVAVIIFFAACWGPLLIDNMLTACGILPHLRNGPLKYMSEAFHLLAYFNSCINPIIYGFMSKHFRESFLAALCCLPGVRRNYRGSSSFSLRQISRTGSHTKNSFIMKC